MPLTGRFDLGGKIVLQVEEDAPLVVMAWCNPPPLPRRQLDGLGETRASCAAFASRGPDGAQTGPPCPLCLRTASCGVRSRAH